MHFITTTQLLAACLALSSYTVTAQEDSVALDKRYHGGFAAVAKRFVITKDTPPAPEVLPLTRRFACPEPANQQQANKDQAAKDAAAKAAIAKANANKDKDKTGAGAANNSTAAATATTNDAADTATQTTDAKGDKLSVSSAADPNAGNSIAAADKAVAEAEAAEADGTDGKITGTPPAAAKRAVVLMA